ncbi:hypothetical protein [Flavobacterium branchiophilum]|uniref:SMI1/KNR4 family protein n=1 Tax=Flavobacterium branchiophilum TaxID=55197 RepID=A0A2H3KS13_9FLAO|nr:hypothetical protein [Flavobacterium branchiophilum]PDS22034.1 hypothetical protein B0A77_14410 [Flavobacterium branchiophilum]
MENNINLFFEKTKKIIKIFENDNTLDELSKKELIHSFYFERKNTKYQYDKSIFVELVLNYKTSNFSIFFINIYNEEDFKEDTKYLYIGNDGSSDGNLCLDKETGVVLIFDYINNYIIRRCYNYIDDFIFKLLDSYIFFLSNNETNAINNIDSFLIENIDLDYREYFKFLILNCY